ncbi:MAG: hypothetical protein Ct9H300mP7_5530 [Verrucomicrobiota bacterium]|nr:MAG: hypothetical protein Ct9H300mP7_5530 [Verrucomicrobiota bacterium]
MRRRSTRTTTAIFLSRILCRSSRTRLVGRGVLAHCRAPLARKQRFVSDYGIPAQDADVFVGNVPLGDFFEQAVEGAKNAKAIANWVINNLQACLIETGTTVNELKFEPAAIRELVSIMTPAPSAARAGRRCLRRCSKTAAHRWQSLRPGGWRRSATAANSKVVSGRHRFQP